MAYWKIGSLTSLIYYNGIVHNKPHIGETFTDSSHEIKVDNVIKMASFSYQNGKKWILCTLLQFVLNYHLIMGILYFIYKVTSIHKM